MLQMAQGCHLWILGEGLVRALCAPSLQCSVGHTLAGEADVRRADIAAVQLMAVFKVLTVYPAELLFL